MLSLEKVATKWKPTSREIYEASLEEMFGKGHDVIREMLYIFDLQDDPNYRAGYSLDISAQYGTIRFTATQFRTLRMTPKPQPLPASQRPPHTFKEGAHYKKPRC